MENQTTTNKQSPSNRSASEPRARPLSPIQNQTAHSVGVPSASRGRPSVGVPSASRGRPSVGAPSASRGRPSVGVPSASRGRPSVGRGRFSVGTPSQPVPKLSQAAEQALAETKKTIRIIDGRDFVYPADFCLLRNDQDDRKKLLNDSVINVYCDLVLERSRKSDDLPKIYVFPTRFGLGWKIGGFEKVQEWCHAPPELFKLDFVFFPLNVNNNHWVLVAASPPTKTIAYYDSMNHDGSDSRTMVGTYLSKIHEVLEGAALDLSAWKSLDVRDIPQQDNGFDCGVFVCQYVERLSRRAPLDFTQSDMPAIRVQMIEEIVAKQLTPSPRHHRPQSEPRDANNVHLYHDLCDLRAKNADLRIENDKLKEEIENEKKKAASKLNEQLINYRKQVQQAKQTADEATAKVDLAQTAEREATAKAEQIQAEATAAVNLAQAAEREANRRAESAERIAADLRTEQETDRQNWDRLKEVFERQLRDAWKEIETLQRQLAEARAPAATQRDQTEADTEAERPDEGLATRSKTPHPTSSLSDAASIESSSESESSSSSSSDDSPPDAANASRADRAAARRRKLVICSTSSDDDDVFIAKRPRRSPPPSPHSAPTQLLPISQSSDEGAIPRNKLAQVPPPPPRSIYFGRSELIPGLVDNGNAGVTVNYPTRTVRDFPPISPPALNFHYWLANHGLSVSQRLEEVMRHDLESRRRFLMDGNLSPEDRHFVISRIPPAYEFGPNYLLALAGLALHSFDVINPVRRRELVFALLYCFSRWNKNTLNKFLNQNL